MSEEVARTILITITSVGGVVWLIALRFLVASRRKGKSVPETASDHFGLFEPLPKNWLLGSVEVSGQPHIMIENAVAILIKQGPYSILEKTKDQLAFEQSGLAQPGPRQARLRFMSSGSGRTRIDYTIQASTYGWLLWLGGMFQLLGLIALVGGSWVINAFCVQSPDPEIRIQTVQIVQVVHFLWPPFLCGALYRHKSRASTEGLETLLRNLPYYQG